LIDNFRRHVTNAINVTATANRSLLECIQAFRFLAELGCYYTGVFTDPGKMTLQQKQKRSMNFRTLF